MRTIPILTLLLLAIGAGCASDDAHEIVECEGGISGAVCERACRDRTPIDGRTCQTTVDDMAFTCMEVVRYDGTDGCCIIHTPPDGTIVYRFHTCEGQ